MVASEAGKPLLATPPADHTYHEMIAQQMKMLQLQQESMVAAATAAAATGGGGSVGGVPGHSGLNLQDMSMMYQNPMAMQQFMWMASMQRDQMQVGGAM